MPLVMVEGSLMRRIRILILAAFACLTLLAIAPSASAGDFADEPCPGSGDLYVCPSGTEGQPYALTFKTSEPLVDCGVMSVSSGEFPPGLSIERDGTTRGTPTRAGSYTFYLTLNYNGCPASLWKPASDRQFTIPINGAVQRLIVTTTGLPDAAIGTAYTAPALSASGGSVSSWSLATGSLPTGLALATNGVISGTPTQSGAFTFTVQANGSPNNDTKQLSLFVLAPLELQTLTGAKLPTTGLTAKAALNAALTTGVKAVGGRGPYVFSSAGALPPGITLNPSTGTLTGTGTTAGRYSTTVTVTDATGAKVSVPWSFTILPLLDFAKGKGLPAGKVGQLYSARIPVSGKDAKAAQFAVSGQIPPGLELDDTGRLTGTLLKAGNYRLRVFAFSASGAPISRVFRIKVGA
jgi:large repetitive protein